MTCFQIPRTCFRSFQLQNLRRLHVGYRGSRVFQFAGGGPLGLLKASHAQNLLLSSWLAGCPMLLSGVARCLARSALAPTRRQLCGGDFGLKNALVTMQLHPGATTKQIKAKFYELAKATHPYATQGSNRLS